MIVEYVTMMMQGYYTSHPELPKLGHKFTEDYLHNLGLNQEQVMFVIQTQEERQILREHIKNPNKVITNTQKRKIDEEEIAYDDGGFGEATYWNQITNSKRLCKKPKIFTL